MYNENETRLIGNVGSITEMGDDDKSPIKVTLFTNFDYKDAEGNQQQGSDRHPVTVFKPGLKKLFREHIKKGAYIAIRGHNKSSSWEKDGETHYSYEVIADSVGFLEPKPAEE